MEVLFYFKGAFQMSFAGGGASKVESLLFRSEEVLFII